MHPGVLNADCPAGLEVVITKALEKDRELRYQSAREVLVDLKRLKGSTSGQTPPILPTAIERRRRRRRLTIGAAAATVAVAAALWSLWPRLFGSEGTKGNGNAIFVVSPGKTEPHLIYEGSLLPQWTYDPQRIYFWATGPAGAPDTLSFVDFDPEMGRALSPA